MELQTAGYFLFLGVVASAHALSARHWRSPLLLGASLIFYALSSAAYLLMFLAICTFNYAAARSLSRAADNRGRSLVFGITLALDLGLLVSFKYSLALVDSALAIWPLAFKAPATAKFAAPLGISYFTFQMIACITDAYRRDWLLGGGLRHFLTFGLFFPQITSGPIPRAQTLLPQLQAGAGAGALDLAVGLRLITYGLFKKFVVANRLDDYVTEIFAAPADALSPHYSMLPTLVGCIFNVLNLYADFSSYVDIAIGSARLMGIRLDANFDRPLTSTSVTELWRRWHMTLSFWLRDYLFMPLLIRIGALGNLGIVVALLFTFAVCGIWHGATWPFLCFGLAQGVAMSVELLTKRWRTRRLKTWLPGGQVRTAGWLYVMTFFVLSEIFFRAPKMAIAKTIFSRLLQTNLIGGFPELFAHKGPFDFFLDFLVVAIWFVVARLFRGPLIISTPIFALLCGLLTLFLGHLGSGRFIYAGF